MEETKRRPGRPKKYEMELSRVDVRLPPDVRRAARIAAAEDEMGLGEWVAAAIREKLARRAA